MVMLQLISSVLAVVVWMEVAQVHSVWMMLQLILSVLAVVVWMEVAQVQSLCGVKVSFHFARRPVMSVLLTHSYVSS